MTRFRFVDRINSLFITVIAAGAVANSVRLGIEPDAQELRKLGLSPEQFPRR